jgi:hypothetical protein
VGVLFEKEEEKEEEEEPYMKWRSKFSKVSICYFESLLLKFEN